MVLMSVLPARFFSNFI
jgi:hypothetical protein